MTFIEMLQQGGYILPQFSSGQQTYQAPNNGMQALQTMMQVDQQGQNRYMQGEQLNLQRSQNTQNIINSTIQNEMSRKTNERLQKQMDLSNKKLEFDMQKAILDDLDKQRTEIQGSFLSRDQLLYDDLLKKQGLDQASMLGKMKGEHSMENFMDYRLNERVFRSTFKNGYTNMQTYSQAKAYVDKTSEELKKAKALMDNNILDSSIYEKYILDAQEAAKELTAFENGTTQVIDFKSPHWAGIIGAPDLLDEVQMKHNINIENQFKAAKTQEEIATSQYTTAKAKQLAETTPYLIAKTEAETKQIIAEMPSQIAILAAQGRIDGAKAKILTDKIDAFYKQYPNPTLEDFAKLEGIIGKDAAKQYTSFENMAVDLLSKGEYDKLEQVYEAAAKLKQAEYIDKSTNSTVTHIKDANGEVVGIKQGDGSIDYGGRTVDKDGKTVTSITIGKDVYNIVGGEGKDKNDVVGLPPGVKMNLVERIDPSTKQKKGYLKLEGDNNNNLEWLFTKYPDYGSFWTNDSLDDFATSDKSPEGTVFEGGYLYIPQDNVKLPAAANSATGTTFFTPGQGTPSAAPTSGKNW